MNMSESEALWHTAKEINNLQAEIVRLRDDNKRLAAALHAAQKHPDWEYRTVVRGYRYVAYTPDGDGWERNYEAETPGDECWRRRKV